MENKHDTYNWGERIFQERTRRGWTQQELAQKIGVTPVTIIRWEHNLKTPRPSSKIALTHLFESEHDIVISNSDEETVFSSFSRPHIFDSSIPPSPASTTGLIGRESIMRRLKTWMHIHNGAWALRGIHGIGKTALATCLAHDHDMQQWFSDGILWAALGVKPNILALLTRWGECLKMPPSAIAKLTTIEAWQDSLRDVIGNRRMLLIIDDAWHSEDALAFKIGTLNCVHLVTTRSKETAYDFTGSEYAITEVEELNQEHSLQLLKALAPEVVKSDPDQVEQLAQAIGGLPLCLTIVGKYLDRQAYCGQLDTVGETMSMFYDAEARNRLALAQSPLERPPHLASKTSISLDTTIEVSDSQLSEQARNALRAFSIFSPKPESFSEEAALTIGNIAREVLAILLDVGLVESAGERRYTLHQTVANWAKRHCEDTTVEERMVLFFMSFIEQHRIDYAVLETEKRTILKAFKMACNRKMLAELIRGMNAFTPFLEARGSYILVKDSLLVAEQLAHSMSENGIIAEIYLHLGRIAELTGKLTEAQAYYEKGLVLAREMQQREIVGALLAHCGTVLVSRGNHIEAEPFLEEGLHLAEEFNQQRMISGIMRNLGEVMGSRGDNDVADEWYRRGLAIARQEQDWELMSIFLQNLGVNAERSGDYTQADLYFKEGMEYARRIRHEQRISAMEMNMGMLAFDQQHYDEAKSLYLRSLERARAIQNQVRISSVLQNLGMLEGVRHRFGEADRYFQESLDIARRIEHSWLISETLYEWGEVYLRQGKVEEAKNVFEQALKQARAIEGTDLIGFALYGLARVARIAGDYVEAVTPGKESWHILKKVGNKKALEIEQWLQQHGLAEPE